MVIMITFMMTTVDIDIMMSFGKIAIDVVIGVIVATVH